MTDRLDALEMQVAHLVRITDELSDVIARQAEEIDRLTRRVELLMGRTADQAEGREGGVRLSDQTPPHW